MTTGPSELTSFGRLRGRFVEAIADSGDANETPDFVAVQAIAEPPPEPQGRVHEAVVVGVAA